MMHHLRSSVCGVDPILSSILRVAFSDRLCFCPRAGQFGPSLSTRTQSAVVQYSSFVSPTILSVSVVDRC